MPYPRSFPRQMREILSKIYKDRMYYVLLIPGLLFFLIFHYLPMSGVVIAFKDYVIFRGIDGSEWVGLANFERLFRLGGFNRALRNTLIISFLKLITGFPLSVLVALLLNELRSRKYNKIVQTSIIMPHFISWVVIYGLLYALFSPSTGTIATIYRTFWPDSPVPNLLADKDSFRGLLVVTHSWRDVGLALQLIRKNA